MWFITTFERIKPNTEDEFFNFPDFGHQRTWGYYSECEKAVQALHKNFTDMWECLYDYALIEEIDEGICAYAGNRQWFKWDNERKGYFEIEEPECVKNLCNFAIG